MERARKPKAGPAAASGTSYDELHFSPGSSVPRQANVGVDALPISPQLIRLMGRWSSDVYEIYCRMSLQAALGVGAAIASQHVDTYEGGFRSERLELLADEMDIIKAQEEAT